LEQSQQQLNKVFNDLALALMISLANSPKKLA
jgi:hypothetical protein